MKKLIGSVVGGIALVALMASCIDSPTEYTIELKTPQCASPPPVLPLDSATISLGCPFRYIEEATGDTLTWVPVF